MSSAGGGCDVAHVAELRGGVAVFGHRRLREWATVAQLTAWALQRLACYALLVALGLDAKAGLGGAAAVLFAVNTGGAAGLPANLGVFKAACVAVLAPYGARRGARLRHHPPGARAAPPVAFGAPAFVGEGLSWRQMRQRALGATPLDPSLRPEARPRPAG